LTQNPVTAGTRLAGTLRWPTRVATREASLPSAPLKLLAMRRALQAAGLVKHSIPWKDCSNVEEWLGMPNGIGGS
jgi:hypothetical protein